MLSMPGLHYALPLCIRHVADAYAAATALALMPRHAREKGTHARAHFRQMRFTLPCDIASSSAAISDLSIDDIYFHSLISPISISLYFLRFRYAALRFADAFCFLLIDFTIFLMIDMPARAARLQRVVTCAHVMVIIRCDALFS